ncbi:MMPL family transporter [Aurantibacter crassamenti]|uniref:MMPL family transporter n=1 Tax=Aurantibacter crassamenti TaxID=1837375 RepID=UPI001939BF06|nr:MMPL family transporter [Aurantibacter crassamenti]MBM1105509.1 MMPL family transporter [Aurantibacter crassamenti]
MGSVFHKTHDWISANKWQSIVLLFLLVSGLAFLASRIQFEEDISKLIPVNEESKQLQKVLKSVNFADKIIVNIQLQNDGSANDLTEFATHFLDSLNKTSADYIKDIQGKIEDEVVLKSIDFVYNNLPLFLDETDYKTIAKKLAQDSIAAITKENYKTLISPSGIIARETILKDPLGLSFIALKKLQQLSFGDDFSIKDGFLLSKDQKNILLFVSPAFESSDTANNEPFVDQLYTIRNTLNNSFQGKAKLDYFGGALIAVANARQIKQDIQFTVSIALTLLFLILILFYRKLTLPIILFTPTALGGLLAIAILFLIRTKVSAISLGIGSILLGVTLDYALHILTHIRNGNSIKRLYKEVAPAILMSSLTTASAFLCLLFLESQALQDLGIFAAISVLGSSVFALLFIPQVYKVSIEKKQGKTILDRIAAFNFHKSKWAIAVVLIAFMVSIFTYSKVLFNKDISQLNYEPKALIDARKRIDALTNIESKSIYIAAYGTSIENTLQTNDQLNQKLATLKKENRIIDYSGVGELVSSKATQEKKINLWKQFWSAEKSSTLQKNLIASGSELGFKPETFKDFYELLHLDFQTLEIADFKALNTIPIQDYINTEDGFTTINSLVKLDSTQVEHIEDTFKNSSNSVLIDRQAVNETFLGNLKNDFNRLIGYSVLVVLLLLAFYYRSFSLTLVTSLPIFLTWFVTVGVMGLFSIQFNIFNIIICTFIFGLGVDYSIFITNGLLAELKTGERLLPTHRTSIILSVITTILGVGVLIFAKHPALHSISLVSLIGILSAVAIAFTLQPLLFKLFIGSSKKRPISLRVLLHSLLSSTYYALGGMLFSFLSTVLVKIIPISKKLKMKWYHKAMSNFLKSVLYSNPFVKKKVVNVAGETFEKPSMIIANHASALDSLTIGMLHPKIIFLVNDWVYNSPVFRFAARLAEFYPVSEGIEKSVLHLQKKIDQGYSLMAFPEGTRSDTNKIRRWHKGAFYLAEQLKLDVVPVLIHGNSEVQPKGSIVIRDGSISVKILKRILSSDKSFGETDRQRTKQIGNFFRTEFQNFRDEIEVASYFQKDILAEYRYKGNTIYKVVKNDFISNKSIYKKIIDFVPKKATIANLVDDYGQLAILLSMDSADRKINCFHSKPNTQMLVQNSFTSQFRGRISTFDTIEKTLSLKPDTLILNLDNGDLNTLIPIISNEIANFILITNGTIYQENSISELGFKLVHQEKKLAIWQR